MSPVVDDIKGGSMMEEKKDDLQVELEKAQGNLKEIIDNSPEAKAKRKIAKIQKQIREKEARKIGKELEKVKKKTQKASKEVDKISAKRQEVAMSGFNWEKDKKRALGKVQGLVSQEMILRAKLKELELIDAPKGKTVQEVYNQKEGSALFGGKKTEDEGEESVTIDLKTYKQKK